MLCSSLSKNCTYKGASARTLRLPAEALPRPYGLGHVTERIWLRACGTTPKSSLLSGLWIRSNR